MLCNFSTLVVVLLPSTRNSPSSRGTRNKVNPFTTKGGMHIRTYHGVCCMNAADTSYEHTRSLNYLQSVASSRFPLFSFYFCFWFEVYVFDRVIRLVREW